MTVLRNYRVLDPKLRTAGLVDAGVPRYRVMLITGVRLQFSMEQELRKMAWG